jgi:hypothetical protein
VTVSTSTRFDDWVKTSYTAPSSDCRLTCPRGTSLREKVPVSVPVGTTSATMLEFKRVEEATAA